MTAIKQKKFMLLIYKKGWETSFYYYVLIVYDIFI